MKAILTVILCLACISGLRAQNYTLTADTTTTCLLQFKVGSQIRVAMKLIDVRYIDLSGGNRLLIFDGVQSIDFSTNQLPAYATLAALKTDLDSWTTQCGQ